MKEEDFDKWALVVKQTALARIMVDDPRFKDKVTKEIHKEILNKIKMQSHINFLNSPHLEGREELKKEAIRICVEDIKHSQSKSSTIKDGGE